MMLSMPSTSSSAVNVKKAIQTWGSLRIAMTASMDWPPCYQLLIPRPMVMKPTLPRLMLSMSPAEMLQSRRVECTRCQVSMTLVLLSSMMASCTVETSTASVWRPKLYMGANGGLAVDGSLRLRDERTEHGLDARPALGQRSIVNGREPLECIVVFVVEAHEIRAEVAARVTELQAGPERGEIHAPPHHALRQVQRELDAHVALPCEQRDTQVTDIEPAARTERRDAVASRIVEAVVVERHAQVFAVQ